jgi:hypothetical protein
MPVLGVVPRGQSEAGFFVDGTFVYREAALTAISSARSGTGRLNAELQRLTASNPGGVWSASFYGNTYADGSTVNPVRWGGTAFVPQWILPGGNATPLASDSDARLDTSRGQVYFSSLRNLLAANAASVDAWAIIWFRQTFEGNSGQWVSIAEYVLGVYLWITYEMGIVAAAMGSKPYRVIVAHPGVTQGGDRRHALLREIQQHLAVNGRRSTRAELASYPVIPNFHVGDHTSDHVTVTTADVADNVTKTVVPDDFLHQTVGSSLHSGARLANEIAGWLAPSVARAFRGFPTVDRAVRVAGDARRVRAVVAITPGNEFRWRGANADDSNINATGGTGANPGHGTLWLHSTPINDATLPAAVAVSSVTVTPGAPSGFAWLDLVTTADVPGGPTYLTVYPDRQTTAYRRSGEAIATNLKTKLGAFEAVPGAPEWTAALPHLVVNPPVTFMPLASATNLLVGPAENFSETPMPLQKSVRVRNAELDAIEATVGASPSLELRTGTQPANCAAADTGSVLATIALPANWMADAVSGVKALAGSWAGTAGANGNVGHFRIKGTGGVCDLQGSVTATGGGGELELSSVAATTGGAIAITGWNLTAGNA